MYTIKVKKVLLLLRDTQSINAFGLRKFTYIFIKKAIHN